MSGAPREGEPAGWARPISVRIPEAVRLTGLSRSRIYELMKAGSIEHVKVGSSTLILFESLRSFVEGQRSHVSPPSGSAAAPVARRKCGPAPGSR